MRLYLCVLIIHKKCARVSVMSYAVKVTFPTIRYDLRVASHSVIADLDYPRST